MILQEIIKQDFTKITRKKQQELIRVMKDELGGKITKNLLD